MSIRIETDIDYIIRRLGISPEVYREKYADKSVSDIIKIEAENGNQAAAKMASEMLNNVVFVIQIFSLLEPENRLEIMKEMNTDELMKFLPQMEKKDLTQGLNFFTTDALLKMLEHIDAKDLVQVVLQQFPKEDIMILLPEEQLDKVLTNVNMDKDMVLDHMKSLPPEYLSQIIESIKGKEVDETDNYLLIKQIAEMRHSDYKDALVSMQLEGKQQLMLGLCKEREEYMQFIDPRAYTKLMETYKEKGDIVKSMDVLEPKILTNMIKELPDELMAIVITQLQPEKFAEILMKENPHIMAKIIAASA